MRAHTIFQAALASALVVQAAVHQVRTTGLEFSPKNLEIKAGDTVEFIFPEAIRHNVIEGASCKYREGGFKSPLQSNVRCNFIPKRI